MNIKILCVGKIKDFYYRNEIESILEEIKKFGHSIECIEFPDMKIPDNMNDYNKHKIIESECEKMIRKISHLDYVIALCIEGKEISTKEHKNILLDAKELAYENVVYIIGGSLGLSDSIKKRANFKLSFSKMTFPHQMMRMVLCEEIRNVLK